jgi:hypothetical protein
MRLAVYSVLVGCGHAAPPPAKPPARPVTAVADLAGKWSASDDMDFVYTLTIGGDGAFDLWEDRNKMGKCEVKGKLALTAGKLVLAVELDTCHRDVAETSADIVVDQFSGDAFTLTVRDDSRAYRRAQ